MWIGVNGGLAISKSSADTVDVNSGGFYTAWTFPNSGSLRKGGRSDTAFGLGATRMPGNFFAPLWADLWHGDSIGGTVCGHIRFQKGYLGDTCIVIAEWDSIGAFSSTGSNCDEATFRAVFNKCDGTIEYQYDNVGTFGQDTSGVVGLEADSTALTVPIPGTNKQPPYLFISEVGYPLETRPRAGWCIKIYQSTVSAALAGWNLLSVGVVPVGGDYSKPALYPKATTAAFAYIGNYVQRATLQNGSGYWMKFAGAQNVGAPGALLHDATDTIRIGWNLVGTIGFPVATSSITQGGGVVLSSAFYDYNGTYHTTTTLKPGQGFWVKASAPGTLTINGGVPAAEPKVGASTNFASLNSITITDNAGRYQTLYLGAESSVKEALSFYQLPPAAPEFDARYSSEGMVETYPARLEEKAVYEYPVNISTEAYPITISWNTVSAPERKIVLTSADGKLGKTVLDGSGRVKISDANVKSIVITLANVDLPKVYALGQNYPNPFNPTTTFSVDIPRISDVNIKVYDVLGREITTLLSGQQPAGTLQVKWDGRDAHGLTAPTGIYFVRMAADDFNTTRKIMLMK
jgi:hypothetical protein